jgi:GNAT superfamily N-acetyltransferase
MLTLYVFRITHLRSPMSLSFRPLNTAAAHLDVILADMECAWKESGRPQSIRPQLELKKEEIRQKKVRGTMAFENGQPVGLAWTELPHGNYGSILLHTLRPEHRTTLAQVCVRSGLMNNLILELIQLRPGNEYRQAFVRMGLPEKLRQKMALPLNPVPQVPEIPPEVSFEPLGLEHSGIAGQISHAAHEVSRDLEGYPDFESPATCAALQQRILQGLFGEVVRPASLFARYLGGPAGVCLVVGIPGWGYPKVAWLLDMVVRPELHGRGLGRIMLRQCLQGVASAHIPIAGLAVTMSNRPALRLYEKTGFQPVEPFYEYIGPTGKT